MTQQKDKEGIVSYGYDIFFGRVIFEEGQEHFVSLNLHTGGSASFGSLETACEFFCNDVEKGKKILLSLSPGREEQRTRKDQWGEYTLAARKYEPLKSEQMDLLQSMYASREEIKAFPNPFEHQPLAH